MRIKCLFLFILHSVVFLKSCDEDCKQTWGVPRREMLVELRRNVKERRRWKIIQGLVSVLQLQLKMKLKCLVTNSRMTLRRS